MIGWMHPWFLLGLAGAGLPILVHFLTRARPRIIRYPTYHLLLEAGAGRQALHRLRTWLVLALRTLAIAALVLAFARPFWRDRRAAVEPGRARRVAVVVDASLSMRAAESGVPVFARARGQAADLLRSLRKGSEAGLIFIGARPEAVLPALSRNLAALHERLSAAHATFERGDPEAALALARRMLAGQGDVYVFSDFQRTNWGPVRFDRLEGVNVYLRPVVEEAVPNVGIVDLACSPGQPVENETIDLACTVFNATAEGRRETVRLDLEGVTRRRDVRLKPFRSATVRFEFSLPTAGCRPGRLRLSGDGLGEDDERYFKIRVRPALEMLLVSDADPADTSSPAFFVATALRPSDDARTGVRVVQRRSREIDRRSLETADAFCLVSPVSLGGDTLPTIVRRVTDGAYLVCFLDGPSSPETLAALRGASDGTVAPPFRLVRLVETEPGDARRLAAPRRAGGPLRVFDQPDHGDLAGLRFRRYFLTESLEAGEDEVLLRYPDGSAALALSPAGRGAAVFANLPVTAGGGNLAGSPLFPVLVHEVLRALRATPDAPFHTPGTAWAIDVLAAAADADYRVTTPRGGTLESTVVSRGRTVRLSLPPVDAPGHYPVLCGGAPADVGVVNVDPKETDTRPLRLQDLVESKRTGAATVSVLGDEGRLTTAGVSLPLWPYLAAVAAACLALETLVLAVWKRRRRPVPLLQLGGRAR